MSERLYLHEVIDVVGQGAVPYMEHTLAFDAASTTDRGLELFGTWYVMGTTGRWPQVVNLWTVVDGWDGWRRLCDRTNLRREANAELNAWWDEAYRHRTGGFDRLFAGAPGCPDLTTLVNDGVAGALFVHELSEVPPGGALEYLAAVRDVRAPVMAERGHSLVGLYRSVFTDTEVCTLWATDLDSHVALQRDGGDGWPAPARDLCRRWREELLIPCPGTPLAEQEPST
jgi:hypothetical protein